MLTLLLKGVQTQVLKFFWLKIFSICHRCQRHRWCTLSREYLREFSKKFEMAVLVYSGAWGKLINEKNQKSKISWHCPFKESLKKVRVSNIYVCEKLRDFCLNNPKYEIVIMIDFLMNSSWNLHSNVFFSVKDLRSKLGNWSCWQGGLSSGGHCTTLASQASGGYNIT